MAADLQDLLAYAKIANIERLQALLERAVDGDERDRLTKLLAEEIERQPGDGMQAAEKT